MSQLPGGSPGTSSAPPAPEKSASSSVSPASAPPTKPRSCVVCRSRKVRCDKQSPCSNCRRANIPCVVPSNDRPPKWARRLERITNNPAAAAAAAANASSPSQHLQACGGDQAGVGQVMERLRSLEGLVKELSGQLEQAHSSSGSPPGAVPGGSSGVGSPEGSSHGRDGEHGEGTSPPINSASMQKHFGRMVLQDTSKSRYISSGFWSRVSDELDGLKMDAEGLGGGDTDSSEDEDSLGKTPSTVELDRTPSERHGFMFGHNLSKSSSSLRSYRPLPSQIPFLISVYSENVNLFVQTVHIPTINKMIRDLRGKDMSNLGPSYEALLFSIYYAAITSMEEDDVLTNFGSTKSELNIKYRLGLEHALARADFLNSPDVVLVQAFTIFLFLVRRHDSPRFVWMMTGLVIRMAQAIGLHRDGAHFDYLTPYEIEIRRRTWWGLCILDMRSSEDQGTEFTIASGSFDTKLPLNINDADIGIDITEPAVEREGQTDMTFSVATYELCEATRRMMAPGANKTLEEQTSILNNLYDHLQNRHIRYISPTGNIAYWVGVTATRLVISKLTLLLYLPALFSSPSDNFSDEVRDKLLVAALEVAEWNHALNAEQDARQWRWIYQTYTHWHAIVYLLLEVTRRPLSPLVERAWLALHSVWLIPDKRPGADKGLRIWVPLRKLMSKARRHREAELVRMRSDPGAIGRAEMSDARIPAPASHGPFAPDQSEEMFRQHWRGLFGMSGTGGGEGRQPAPSITVQDSSMSVGEPVSGSYDMAPAGFPQMPFLPGSASPGSVHGSASQGMMVADGAAASSYGVPAVTVPELMGPGFTPWLWNETTDPLTDTYAGLDMDMDVDSNVDWNSWLDSAAGMELNVAADPTQGGPWPTGGSA
ncbi:unnamed protein product [Clonostachys solani]|uniref:Zn(2)-C6 fungal-type domain-containing protein n=1 Tax=Clonostachys solani TaxID=160281 RepID=A0A9N9Z8J7_9HYPO|nr:unnamed protein product [Clonostachys solani]